jgi:hypothetical protein
LPKIEIRECLAEIGHECLDVRMTIARRMQRILQEHVGSGELVNDAEIASFTPEICKPATYNGLVVCFFGNDAILLLDHRLLETRTNRLCSVNLAG